MARYETILDTIGNTPLVRLHKLAPPGVNVYVKIESFNPMGSVKDRMARAVIEAAERSGELLPGQTVVEATSGNTGIGLAMVCARKGYPLVVVMAENFSVERRKLLRFLGAKVVLTPAAEKGTGMLDKARALAEAHGYYLCRQFENEANAAVHTETTAREILADFREQPLHYFVSGFGTGGTLKGVSRGLKAADPGIRVVAVEPDNSPVLASGVTQPRNTDGSPAASHPWFRPHLMQGWSPDFLSSLTEEAVEAQLVDEVVGIAGADALRLARELACVEGIFAGISGGATLAGALQLAHRVPAGTNIVCMLPDTGERYLSTPLFEDIGVDMNADELALSASTPGCQFGPPGGGVPAPVDGHVTPDFGASRFVADTVGAHPVVMFALEWCEFCWSARNFFKALGVDFHSVDLDSVAFQPEERGVRIREVLRYQLGTGTIPQIFVGGVHIGGCTELFTSYREGSLQRLLAQHGIRLADHPAIDTSRLLPGWMHPRKSA
ncbi:MAG: cysteine synthase A [Halieaceae bacterium]|nr:cysteine synthase A [Halieaceae bacterium]